MSGNLEEQEMEIEALFAILMDDIRELDPSESNLGTSSRCFEITILPMGDDEEEPTDIPVRLALTFAHTPEYPDEPPILQVKSLRGIQDSEISELQTKLESEASDNLGMSMIYTLVSSAKEWLRERFGPSAESQADGFGEEVEESKEEVIEAHGLPVNVETFNEWREAFEAELALEKAKLLPDAVVAASKEKKLTGRQWFESGRHLMKGVSRVGAHEEEEEDEEFEDDFDEDDDDEAMLEHYLGQRENQQPS